MSEKEDKNWVSEILKDPCVITVLVMAGVSLFFLFFNFLNAVFTSSPMICLIIGAAIALAVIHICKHVKIE